MKRTKIINYFILIFILIHVLIWISYMYFCFLNSCLDLHLIYWINLLIHYYFKVIYHHLFFSSLFFGCFCNVLGLTYLLFFNNILCCFDWISVPIIRCRKLFYSSFLSQTTGDDGGCAFYSPIILGGTVIH